MEKFETAFKLVIFFTNKTTGDPFTADEMKEYKHRRYIGSFDNRRGEFKHKITDLKEAFRKMEHHLRNNYANKYTTAFIIVNNYKGFTFPVRKYVYNNYKGGMAIEFIKMDAKGNTNIYNIPDANVLIDKYYANTLTDEEKKLIKKKDDSLPVALPYYLKGAHLVSQLRQKFGT